MPSVAYNLINVQQEMCVKFFTCNGELSIEKIASVVVAHTQLMTDLISDIVPIQIINWVNCRVTYFKDF